MIQKPFRGVQLNRTHPLAKGLVGCWLFNEITGETVFDLSGNGNNGTLENGVAWSSEGLKFDGGDDYIDCGNNENLNIANVITLEAWIKTTSSDELYESIVSKGGYTDVNSNYDFGVRTQPVPSLYFYWKADGTYYGTEVVCSVLTDGKFHHVVGIRDNAYNLEFFVDGVSIGTDTGSLAPVDGGQNIHIGLGKTGHNYNGSIDSVSIYNQAKSADEVTWLYREPYAMFEPAFNPAILYSPAPPVGAIINQFQKANIGADLYNGVFA